MSALPMQPINPDGLALIRWTDLCAPDMGVN
jgi:hypothetical protein